MKVILHTLGQHLPGAAEYTTVNPEDFDKDRFIFNMNNLWCPKLVENADGPAIEITFDS